MPKVIKKSNYRVVVTPHVNRYARSLHSPDTLQKAFKEKADELLESIKRHCDDIDTIEVKCDTEELCSHCGLGWEEDENGEPVCCPDAVKEYKESKTVAG